MKWSQRLGDVEFKHMHVSIREHMPKPTQESLYLHQTQVEWKNLPVSWRR